MNDRPTEVVHAVAMAMKAIFFDMDGTLVDSEPLWGQVTAEFSRRLGHEMTDEELYATMGGSFDHTVTYVGKLNGRTFNSEERKELMRVFYAEVMQLMKDVLVPKPGVVELLESVSAAGIPQLVTTNTYRTLADVEIAAVGTHFFSSSVAGDEVENGKPDPEMYLKAAEIVGAKPEECLVFEDSVAGMTAARDAGCVVIGLPPSHGDAIDGVATLQELHGSDSFEGVTVDTCSVWFTQLGSNA